MLPSLEQMASALMHTHELGLAHLDVKPDNIYRSLTDPSIFKLGDFGLATRRDGSKGLITEGDARYLAPELLKNQLSCLDKADMFALGATVYELAIGNGLSAEGERWVALREGKLMTLPAVSQQLQALIKVGFVFISLLVHQLPLTLPPPPMLSPPPAPAVRRPHLEARRSHSAAAVQQAPPPEVGDVPQGGQGLVNWRGMLREDMTTEFF